MLIAITHCGVCRSDAHFIDNDWQDSQFPMVPGHEIVGRIIALGEKVQNFKLGQRVGACWQQGACLHCEWCLQEKEEFCSELKAVCLQCRGGFADKVIVDYRFVYALPENLDSAAIAPLLCAGITVFHALTAFNIHAGMRVGIVGLGGLGHLAVQFAKAMGCRVSVFSSSPDKATDAQTFGAEEFIVTTDINSILKQRNRFDFILVTVYVDQPYQAYIEALRPQGKLCFVGIPVKPVAISIFSLLIGQKSVCASPMGNKKNIKAMLAFAAQHNIRPQVEVMPMTKVNAALKKVRLGQARYRIVLTNEIA